MRDEEAFQARGICTTAVGAVRRTSLSPRAYLRGRTVGGPAWEAESDTPREYLQGKPPAFLERLSSHCFWRLKDARAGRPATQKRRMQSQLMPISGSACAFPAPQPLFSLRRHGIIPYTMSLRLVEGG
jgi:hypothetical protein